MERNLSSLVALHRADQQRNKKEEEEQKSKYPENPDRLVERKTAAKDVLEGLPFPEILSQGVNQTCQKARAAQAKRARSTNKENFRNFTHLDAR
jgi:hypothetical protein